MNGINLKKLGAIVAGGAILASSVAFAGLVFQNTELVNANGQPVAKIVVGANAAASDGVAAAMIATKIANSAYSSKEYTAAVQGTASCVSSNGTAGGATCAVTDKTVTLEIVYPGMTGTAIHEFKPLIAETLDKEVNDRAADYDSVLTDLMDEKGQPFQDNNGQVFTSTEISESDGDAATARYYKIDGTLLNALADYSMTSKQTSNTYKESQRIFLHGDTEYDSSEKKTKFSPDLTVYQLVFGPNEEGLSLCPGDSAKAVGACDESDMLGKNRFKVKLLGSDWVISDVVTGTGAVQDSSAADLFDADKSISIAPTGFTLKLAKEATYNPALHKGECMNTTDVKICLSDIARETTGANLHPAIMSIYDNAGNLVTEKQITEGTTEDITVGSKTVKVHVYQTAPGYAMQAMWAEIAIYSDEIELNEGKEFTNGIKGYSGDKSNWNVYFGVVDKNSDGTAGNIVNATGLRTITFATADSSVMSDGDLFSGDSYNVIDAAGYQGFEVKNNGLETWDTDNLKFEYKNGGTPPTANITQYVKIHSDQDRAFEVGSWKRGSTVIIGYNETGGTIALKDYDNNWHNEPFASTLVKYAYAGDQAGITSDLDPAGKADDPANLLDFNVTYAENVGKVNDSDMVTDGLQFFVDCLTNHEVRALQGSSGTDTVAFSLPAGLEKTYGYTDGSSYETGFTTLRGTVFSGESSTTRTLQVPKSVRHVQLAVKPTTLNASRNSEIIGPLHEGDSATVGGSITVTVNAISVQTSASVSGGTSGGAATADMSGVTAVIKDASGASMSTLTAQSVYAVDPATLTYLDSQAPATGTVITVGGPKVNSVTAAAMQGAAIDLSAANPVVTKEAGDKIIVAGWTAADTITAASNFIAALKAQ
jgi:hypothetical protein